MPKARFGKGQTVGTAMLENFITAFIVYFVVIDPVGNAPIFLAITSHLPKRRLMTVHVFSNRSPVYANVCACCL